VIKENGCPCHHCSCSPLDLFVWPDDDERHVKGGKGDPRVVFFITIQGSTRIESEVEVRARLIIQPTTGCNETYSQSINPLI
jgi:hypothetical protein